MTLMVRPSAPADKRRPRAHCVITTTWVPKSHAVDTLAGRLGITCTTAPWNPIALRTCNAAMAADDETGLGAKKNTHRSWGSPRKRRCMTRALAKTDGAKRPGL